ncbi:hypothetical protein [Bacillus pinisoli]|nr:hypothetical protein [Bacillus pinisoli]
MVSIFKGNEVQYLSNDGVHPSLCGYQVIADAFRSEQFGPLSYLDE